MALHITSNTKSLILRPSSKKELHSLIKEELDRQGPDADLNFIDTSLITDMSYLFYDLDIRNIKIDRWNVSNVKYMTSMFERCGKFDSDLSDWDTSNVTNMSMMFYGCKNFKGTGLDGWDVSNVINMNYMFYGCINFNGTLSNWNTSNVKDMSEMFYDCTKFKSDLSSWNVYNVEDNENMFAECPNMLDNPQLQPKFTKLI